MSQPNPTSCWKLAVLLSVLLVPGVGLANGAGAPEDTPFQRAEPPRSAHLLEEEAFQVAPGSGPQERLSGRHSALSGVLLGASLGAFVGGLLTAPFVGGELALSVFVPLGAVIGALIGNGLSDDGGSASSRVTAKPRVQPLLGVSHGSAAMGLGGRF